MRKFKEFVNDRDDYENAKEIILNILGAEDGAMDSPLADFKNSRELLDSEKNPSFVELINKRKNGAEILKAIKGSRSSLISIADLLAMFLE